MSLIYDCFIFNDELELLELRLMETYDLVDWFVLVEAPYNWQLKPKPLFYRDNEQQFKKWYDKIIHVVATSLPLEPFPVTETAQRELMELPLGGAKPEDIIIVSDADEILSRGALKWLRKTPPLKPVTFKQHLYYYYVNCKMNQPWRGPVASLRKDVTPLHAHAVRATRHYITTEDRGGWHFSWLGDAEQLQYKLRCHTIKEDSKGSITPPDPDDTQFLQRCISNGEDLFSRNDYETEMRTVEIEPGTAHPVCIEEWLEKYPDMAK